MNMPEPDTEAQLALLKRIRDETPDTWENIKYILDDTGRPVEEAAAEIYAIYNEDYLASKPENERVVHAGRIFYSRLIGSWMGSASPYQVLVLDKSTPRTFTKKSDGKEITIANLYGVGRKADEDDAPVGFVNIVFFNEAAGKVRGAKRGRQYRVMLTEGKDGGFVDGVYSLTATDSTSFNQEVDGDDVDAASIVRQLWEPVPIHKLIDNPHDFVSRDPNDLKLVKGNITYATVRQGKTGNLFGRYSLVDDSLSAKAIRDEKAALSIMVDPTQVRFGEGSDVYALGRITYSDEYGPGMEGRCIIAGDIGIPLPEDRMVTEDDVEANKAKADENTPVDSTTKPGGTNADVIDFGEDDGDDVESDAVVDFSDF